MGCTLPQKGFEAPAESRQPKYVLSKHKNLQSLQLHLFEEIAKTKKQLLALQEAKKLFYAILNLDAFFFRRKSSRAFHAFLFHLKVNGKQPKYIESVPYLRLEVQSRSFRLYEYYVLCLEDTLTVLEQTIRALTQAGQLDTAAAIGTADQHAEQEWTRTKQQLQSTIKKFQKRSKAILRVLELFQTLAKETHSTRPLHRLCSVTPNTREDLALSTKYQ